MINVDRNPQSSLRFLIFNSINTSYAPKAFEMRPLEAHTVCICPYLTGANTEVVLTLTVKKPGVSPSPFTKSK